LDLDLREILMKCYIWSTALYGVKTWTLRKIDQKYFENIEMWRWKRMETSWSVRVKNGTLQRVKEGRNIPKR
jgi:hypothetical protein